MAKMVTSTRRKRADTYHSAPLEADAQELGLAFLHLRVDGLHLGSPCGPVHQAPKPQLTTEIAR